MSVAPKRTGWREIEGERERCCDVKWRNSCGLIRCLDQSFAVRKDREMNILCDRKEMCCHVGDPTAPLYTISTLLFSGT